MDKCVFSVELPSDLFLAVHDLATEKQGTVGNVLEDLLTAHLETRRKGRHATKTSDERLVFALQKLLFRDLSEAASWADLNTRLNRHGYYLKVAWGGLSLHTHTSGQRLCNLHDLGFSYGQFVRRFGPGKPEDPHDISSVS